MNTFWFSVTQGFNHVLDINGLDHFYFLFILAIPFGFKRWKKLLFWVSLFSIGHTISLFFSHYFQTQILPSNWIEFLIALTILFTCLLAFLRKGEKKISPSLILLFGIIHGLGFAKYFKKITFEENATATLLQFALGIEFAQILIVLGVLLCSAFVVSVIRLRKNVWITLALLFIFYKVCVLIKNTFLELL